MRQPIRLADYRPPAFLIDSVDLAFELEEAETVVESRLAIRMNPQAHRRSGRAPDLVLDAEDLALEEVTLDDTHLVPGDYEISAGRMVLAAPPERFELRTRSRVRPAENTRLEGLYVSNGTFCTQCEAEGFRRITPFLDRPDVMATYRVTVRGDKRRYPVLLSNGNLVATRDLAGGRHEAVWHDPFPKPSYLFALVAGGLSAYEDSFVTASGRKVALKIWVEPGNEPRCAYAMDALKRAMRWDEDVYGLEYDLDLFNIVAISDFNMGAMENKSLNVFNAKYILADPETATDDDYAFIEAVVAHEYFHNWTGNRVTCRDWFQLSLKEGLTVFRDQQFSADMRSAPVKRIQDVRALRARQFPEDAGPLAHPVRPDSYIEINNFYTATVYDKGAEVVRMLHRMLGPTGFRRGIDLYFERHDGQAVTCDDFVAAMTDANGADLEQFKLWYSQAGTPRVEASGRYDPDGKAYELTLTQRLAPTPGQPEKRPMRIPLAVGLVDSGGREIPLRLDGRGEAGGTAPRTVTLQLAAERQTFRFSDVGEAPLPSLNRGFSAPVSVQVALSDADRVFLMGHDPDSFARWEAGQQYATGRLLAAVRGDTNPAGEHELIAALRRTLLDDRLDRAFRALALALPSEDYLSDQMETVDVEGVHAAREALRRAIAGALRDDLFAIYHGALSNEPFSPDAASAGRRALKNAALAYLALLDDAECRALVTTQYQSADNMTDRVAALRAIADWQAPATEAARERALADFHDRFRKDGNVLDKWFAIQATSSREDTLERVRALSGHADFTMRNPNKVRALVGAFASGNAVRFHRPDGAGYRFLADRILELDRLNPQVAARLTPPLGRWRRYDASRQALMKAELRRLLAASGLSADVYEIAAKSLES